MICAPVATVYPGGSTNILVDMGRLMPAGWLPRTATVPAVRRLHERLQNQHGIEIWGTADGTTSRLDVRLFWRLSDDELALATLLVVDLAEQQDLAYPA